MKKVFILPIMAIVAILAMQSICHQAQAKVDYMETLSIGTSTTSAVGSSTVLADTTRGYDRYAEFEAWIQYSNPVTPAVPMRYTIATGTPTANSGAQLFDGDILILRNLTDMKNFKACAGTTTTASYGTASVMYCPAQEPDTSPVYIDP